MNIAKGLTQFTDEKLKEFLNTESGKALVRYVDDTPAVDGTYTTKKELYDDYKAGLIKGDLRKADGFAWDHVVLELGHDQAQAQAIAKVVIKAFANPNFKVKENQGNGNNTDKDIKGQAEVLYDLHVDDSGKWHAHIVGSLYSLDGINLTSRSSVKDNYTRTGFKKFIDAELTKNGLPELAGFTSEMKGVNTKISPATRIESRQVATGQVDIADVMESVKANVNGAQDLGQTLLDEMAEHEKLLQQAKDKQERIVVLQKANEAINANKLLLKTLDDKTADIETLTATTQELNGTVEELKTTIENVEQQNNDLIENLSNANSEVHRLKTEVIEPLTVSKNELEELLTDAESDLKQAKEDAKKAIEEEKEKALLEIEKTKKYYLEQIKSKDDLISFVKKANDTLQNSNANLRSELQEQKEEIAGLKSEHKSAIDAKNAEIADISKKHRTEMDDQIAISAKQKAEQDAAISRMMQESKQQEKLHAEQMEQLSSKNNVLVEENKSQKELVSVYQAFIEIAEKRLKEAQSYMSKIGAIIKKSTDKALNASILPSTKAHNDQVKKLDEQSEELKAQIAERLKHFNQSKPDDQSKDGNVKNKDYKPK